MFPICLAANAALARRGDGIGAAVMGVFGYSNRVCLTPIALRRDFDDGPE
jgi:hypothetical protein